jgi:hypothetical protein
MFSSLGNPAPFGLLCFGMTSLTLAYVEVGWAETDFEVVVASVAVGLGGLGQILVGIFELLKGNSFSFAVFVCYGASWWTFAILYMQRSNLNSTFGEAEYQRGMALYLGQWGVLTVCFWIITWRKNVALITIFSLLSCTFVLLAVAAGTGSSTCKLAGGYFRLITALGAMYSGVAELINQEYGRIILPGLAPLHNPHRILLTKHVVRSLINYDARSNTLWLHFRGLQIRSLEDIEAIRGGVVSTIGEAMTAGVKRHHHPLHKVHVIADYDQTLVADDIAEEYWNVASALERGYYLSVTQFHVTSFVTRRPTRGRRSVGMLDPSRRMPNHGGCSVMNTPNHAMYHTTLASD